MSSLTQVEDTKYIACDHVIRKPLLLLCQQLSWSCTGRRGRILLDMDGYESEGMMMMFVFRVFMVKKRQEDKETLLMSKKGCALCRQLDHIQY